MNRQQGVTMGAKSFQVTIDAADHEEAEGIFREFGLDTTTAVGLFIKSVIRTRSIPFPPDTGRPAGELASDPGRIARLEALCEDFRAYLEQKHR